MLMKHFIVYFGIVLILAVPLQGQQCDATSGCNKNSYCDVASGYCSCLSGFSGNDCSIQPHSSCASSYNLPSAHDSLDSTSEASLNSDTLNIIINAPLEQNRYVDSSAANLVDDTSFPHSLGTTITWSNPSIACDYPSSDFWTKKAVVDGSCVDSYSMDMNWLNAKTDCGFVYDSDTNSWSANVTINRHYAILKNNSLIEGQKRDVPLIVEGNDELKSDMDVHKKDDIPLIMPGQNKRGEVPPGIYILTGQTAQKRDDIPLIMNGQKRDDVPLIQGRSTREHDESIRVVSQTFTITVQEDSQTDELTLEENKMADTASDVNEEAAVAHSSVGYKGIHLQKWQIAVAAAGASVGVLFVVVIALVVIVRRRNARKAQAQFNFEGLDSN